MNKLCVYFLTSCWMLVFANLFAHYAPSVDSHIKFGDQRHIGRIHALMPIIQNQNNLLFADIIGMKDSKRAVEGNFGIGFRHLNGQSIFGVYGYYDIRKTRFDKRAEQLTFGAEWLKEDLELRANVYVPLTSSQVIASTTTRSTIPHLIGTKAFIHQTTIQLVDKPTHGFDVEFGHNIPFMKHTTAYLGYYYFGTNGISAMHGVRARANWSMNNYVGLEAELSHDKKRGTNVFAGINLRYQFEHNQLTKLKRKMTQMPIRDVDVITIDNQVVKDNDEELENVYLVSTKDELRAALMAGLNSYKDPDDDRRPVIIVAGDIVATDADRDWRLIGDRCISLDLI